jgi:hypothetical protein
MRTLFKKSSPQTVIKDIEEEIASLQLELEEIIIICDIITVILAYVEIDKFKSDKIRKYFEMLKLMSEQELGYSQVVYSIHLFIYLSLIPIHKKDSTFLAKSKSIRIKPFSEMTLIILYYIITKANDLFIYLLIVITI